MEHTKKMILVDPRVLNALNTQAATAPVPDVLGDSLRELDQEMQSVLGRHNVGFHDKAKLYQQTLRRYLNRVQQYKDRPLGFVDVTDNPNSQESPPPPSSSSSQEPTPTSFTIPSQLEKEVLLSVPKSYKKKGREIVGNSETQ
jgi:hypothetical protein